MKFPRCDETRAWQELTERFEQHGRRFDLRDAFALDPDRFQALTIQAPEVFADLSKNLIDAATLGALLELARECGLEERREAMFSGAHINTTEDRAVLHTALRAPRGAAPFSDDVHRVLDAMLSYAETVRRTSSSGIRHVVNIGIGGSDLGPQMVVPALEAFVQADLTFHSSPTSTGRTSGPCCGA